MLEMIKKGDYSGLTYPRPQFVRQDNWSSLDGQWDFTYDNENIGEKERWFLDKSFTHKINVPYVYQSKLSGIGDAGEHNIIWYKRTFEMEQTNKRTFIHFEAVDYLTKVWLNGQFIGEHEGGHVPFSFELTDQLDAGSNKIVIRVEDKNSCAQIIGKQSWKDHNFLCWYTRTTGIWQSVWLEQVESFFIEEAKMTPNVDKGTIELEVYTNGDYIDGYLQVQVSYKGKSIRRSGMSIINDSAKLSIDVSMEEADFRVEYWTPDTPNLYDITFTLEDKEEQTDCVQSYFGMRKIDHKGRKVLLNNKEFYQKLILDQGYYGEGLLTPRSIDDLVNDLLKVKEMGFNGVRMHQKVADRRYMYLCDLLGVAMWAEVPSFFELNEKSINNALHETKKIIEKHYNHPSTIIYTLMNESWGINEVYENEKQQQFVNFLYQMAKLLDQTRLIIGNDGWEHTLTDILTIHDYTADHEVIRDKYKDFEEAVNGSPSSTSNRQNYSKGYKYNEEPIIISEYGGIAFHHDEDEESWGYGERLTSEEAVLQRLEDLTRAFMDLDYVSGICYTQLTDVEQEVNGLLDHNHDYKFDPQKIRAILNYKYNNGYIFE